MEKYIRKYFWTINLVTIALCAYLAAQSINTFVGGYLLSDTELTVPVQSAQADTGAEPPKKPSSRKASVNPFTGEAMTPQEPLEEVDDSKPAEPIPENPEEFDSESQCQGVFSGGTLMATVEASDPSQSYAIVEDSDKKTMIYEIGDKIGSSGSVLSVKRKLVFVRNGNRIECLVHGELDEKKKPKTPEDAAAEAGDGIRKVSETEYIIAEGELNRALENMNALATQARIVPSFKNGKGNGFRIYSIKPGSLYQKIGIKNGDIIQRVNGMDLDSPEKALEIYSKLRSEKGFTLDLLRRGSKVSVDYTIQ